MSQIERTFLGAPPAAAVTFQLCVGGDGRLDATDLEQAVGIEGEYCPGSRCTAVDADHVDTGRAPEVVNAGVPPPSRAGGEFAGRSPGGDSHPDCEVILNEQFHGQIKILARSRAPELVEVGL
jgi:hypothetical protein